ncbi:hypothetical protein [Speluncibacter jeojiensis]|uniref:Uncharacterized protein n=1 Tax=Speluncibacter jeojiensis TaxID=2710754 RepID=A0A9X4RFF8_9ACTN|nr:hypothetical protein [Corynebacteriales bacterium D3-21]
MPKSLQEIIDSADELAKRFEAYEPSPDDQLPIAPLYALRAAAEARSRAEKQAADAVSAARDGGYSWSLIGSQLGTSGEAARQRYGSLVEH